MDSDDEDDHYNDDHVSTTTVSTNQKTSLFRVLISRMPGM